MSSPEATLIGVLADTTGPRQTRTTFAGQEGLEPPTTGFGDRDSGQLSYCPSESTDLPGCVSRRAEPGAEATKAGVYGENTVQVELAPSRPELGCQHTPRDATILPMNPSTPTSAGSQGPSRISARIGGITESATLAVDAKAK